MGTHRKIRCLVKRCFGMLQITEIYLTETVALESLAFFLFIRDHTKCLHAAVSDGRDRLNFATRWEVKYSHGRKGTGKHTQRTGTVRKTGRRA